MHRKRSGFTLIELVIVIAIILVLITIAGPNFMTAHRGADETAVIRATQSIHQAQVQYMSMFGVYAANLSQLGPPVAGAAEGPQAAKLIPASLASGERNGYLFSTTLTPAGFIVHANPKVFGGTGRRTFYIDQDGVVRQNWGVEPATDQSPEVK